VEIGFEEIKFTQRGEFNNRNARNIASLVTRYAWRHLRSDDVRRVSRAQSGTVSSQLAKYCGIQRKIASEKLRRGMFALFRFGIF
jgi:hypothetical protein